MPESTGPGGAAMDRLNNRQNGDGNQASSKAEGFEAAVHRIKEQVLPRLLERVDPEAAATLSKDELAEEFRPIISEVLAELKITLNRREQFALEKVLVDELLGLGPLEERLSDPSISDITRRPRSPMPVFRTAAASTSSFRRSRSAGRPSPFVSSPKSRSRSI